MQKIFDGNKNTWEVSKGKNRIQNKTELIIWKENELKECWK